MIPLIYLSRQSSAGTITQFGAWFTKFFTTLSSGVKPIYHMVDDILWANKILLIYPRTSNRSQDQMKNLIDHHVVVNQIWMTVQLNGMKWDNIFYSQWQSEFSAFSAIISDNKTSTALLLISSYSLGSSQILSNYLLVELMSLEQSLYVQDSSGFYFHVCSCCCCYYWLCLFFVVVFSLFVRVLIRWWWPKRLKIPIVIENKISYLISFHSTALSFISSYSLGSSQILSSRKSLYIKPYEGVAPYLSSYFEKVK